MIDRLAEIAVPPKAPAPRQHGTFSFSVEKFWDELVPNFKLREANDQAAVVGPFLGRGWCLEPLGRDGDLRWFDPTLPAKHGDLVLVQLTEKELDLILERSPEAREHVSTFGPLRDRLVCKVLVEFGGEYWLMEKESMFRLGDNRILGVAVRCERDDVALYEPIVAQIANNATTDTYSASAVGPVTFTTTFTTGGHDVSGWAANVNLTAPLNCVAIVKCSCNLDTRISLTPTYVDARAFDGTTAQTSRQSVNTIVPSGSTLSLPVAVNGNFNLSAGVNYDIGMYVTAVSGAGVTNQAIARDIYVSVELIKK